jgi:tellurite resistance protein
MKLDWVESSLFLMIASAEATDHYLDEQEIETIIEKTTRLVLNYGRKEELATSETIQKKFNKMIDWYNTIGDTAPQGKMDTKIADEVQKAINHLKNQAWFNRTFAQSLISDLVDIAEADGEVIEKEKKTINEIARMWGVEEIFN